MEKGRLTIGLPIYNEEKTLRKTLDSIISNLDDVDLVIISDNHSTDATQTICREYCKKYDKIRYRRNLVNIGAWQNMAKLLEEVNTEFYMQLGGHDFLEPGCIALLKGGMTDNVVCCFGRTENQIKDMVIKDNYIEYKEELLSNVPGKRFVTYLLADMVNEPYFGIMRTKIFKEAIAKYGNYRGLSVDVLVVAYMTLGGALRYIPEAKVTILIRQGESICKRYSRYRKVGMEVPYINPRKTFYHYIMELTYSERTLRRRRKLVRRILHQRCNAYEHDICWIWVTGKTAVYNWIHHNLYMVYKLLILDRKKRFVRR